MFLKKSHSESNDFMFVLCDWRNSPTPAISILPVQRVTSKRTELMLPIGSTVFYQKLWIMCRIVLRKREQSKTYYDRTRRPLCTLKEENVVRIRYLAIVFGRSRNASDKLIRVLTLSRAIAELFAETLKFWNLVVNNICRLIFLRIQVVDM